MELPVVENPPHRCTALVDHLARRMRTRAESALEPLGLRSRHFIALTVLRDRPEGTQQALAAALAVDRTNLVGLLNDLEGRDLVERRRSEEDRRRHIVVLTTAGAELLAQAEFALAAAEDEVLVALDATQRETLYGLLHEATVGAMDADCSPDVPC